MKNHSVVIVGAGPTGLMLAGELALSGVDVGIVERRPNQDIVGTRTGGLHARTLEVLDQRGIADRFVSQGQKYPFVGFAMTQLSLADIPSRHNYTLGLFQNRIERILAEWVAELKVPIYRERDVTGFTQDHASVEIVLSSHERMRGEYLVGCDGGRSSVRKTAGIDFPGWDATMSWLIAEAKTREEPPMGFRTNSVGTHAIAKADDGTPRFVVTETHVGTGREPTLQDLRQALIAAYGTDFGIQRLNWISRFTDMARQAARYRDRRVLLAGDAAHIHAPIGGQGLNIGVQDAVNLGWKLADVLRGDSPETLLDTYHAERHPIGARVLRDTMAQVALRRTDDRSTALNQITTELLSMEEPRRRVAAMMSGLDVRYDLGDGHPLLGRRMPDLDIVTASGPVRVCQLLHDARPVLLTFDGADRSDVPGWNQRVKKVAAQYDGTWELPVVGVVSAPDAVLIRPDGYVAWVAAA